MKQQINLCLFFINEYLHILGPNTPSNIMEE